MSQSTTNDPTDGQPEQDAQSEVDATTGGEETTAPDQAADEMPETLDVDHDDHDDGTQQGSSLAGMALRFLILVLVVFGIALWALPRLAPHLPESMAKHLFPTQQVVDQRLAALEAQATSGAGEEVTALTGEVAALKAEIAALQGRLASAETDATAAKTASEQAADSAGRVAVSETVLADAGSAATRAAEAAGVATSAATEAGTVASAAMRNTAALVRRVTSFEAQMTALSEEISALGDGLATAGTGEGGASPQLAAAYSALKARVDGLSAQVGGSGYLTATEAAKFATQDDLRATRTALAADLTTAMGKLPAPETVATSSQVEEVQTGLSEQLASLTGRVETVEAAATTAAESASAAQAEVGGAIRDASLRSAVAALKAQMASGLSFAAPLDEVSRLSEQAVPDALAAVAESGIATPSTLLKGFGRTAQEAVAADLRASADGNILGQATARLRSLTAGRPKDAQEGDDVPSILSRVEAAVSAGDLNAALSQTDNLPEAAAGAMEGWIGKLKARVSADAALTEYVAGLGVPKS